MNSAIKTGVVPEFRGDYFFLSNYYEQPFLWRGHEFKSSEQAFAYAKTFCVNDGAEGDYFRGYIMKAATPGEAKKLGRQVDINVPQWDGMRVQYMREIVHAKFATGGDAIVGKLLNTGVMMLVEGNDWGDTTWGRCKNKDGVWVGLNILGVILMEERGLWLRG